MVLRSFNRSSRSLTKFTLRSLRPASRRCAEVCPCRTSHQLRNQLVKRAVTRQLQPASSSVDGSRLAGERAQPYDVSQIHSTDSHSHTATREVDTTISNKFTQHRRRTNHQPPKDIVTRAGNESKNNPHTTLDMLLVPRMPSQQIPSHLFTLQSNTTHLLQRSSPEGSLVHAVDANPLQDHHNYSPLR